MEWNTRDLKEAPWEASKDPFVSNFRFITPLSLESCANAFDVTDQPATDPKISGDAFKTLFVGRLSYEATKVDLEREFGRFGPIDKVCVHCRCDWRSCFHFHPPCCLERRVAVTPLTFIALFVSILLSRFRYLARRS